MREKSLLRERKRIMAQRGVTWQEAGELQSRKRKSSIEMGGYKMPISKQEGIRRTVKRWLIRWEAKKPPQTRQERVWRNAMQHENVKLMEKYMMYPEEHGHIGGRKCGKGWHGDKLRHRMARIYGVGYSKKFVAESNRLYGGKKKSTWVAIRGASPISAEVAKKRRANLNKEIMRIGAEGFRVGGKVFHADHDEIGNLRVWSPQDWKDRNEESTWYFDDEELKNMPLKNAVVLLESSGAIR